MVSSYIISLDGLGGLPSVGWKFSRQTRASSFPTGEVPFGKAPGKKRHCPIHDLFGRYTDGAVPWLHGVHICT